MKPRFGVGDRVKKHIKENKTIDGTNVYLVHVLDKQPTFYGLDCEEIRVSYHAPEF